jgi:iron complex outermembrane receptor protein
MRVASKVRLRYAAILSTTALISPSFLAGTAQAQSAPQIAAVAAAPATADTSSQAAAIGEVVVTAERRSENIQHVPISMQALSTQTLAQHQVVALDDYVKLLPSVSFQTLGPGRSDLFFRGISTGAGGLLPTSGMYLDDIPIQTSGRSLDVHLYDVSRVEALSGPQGTLFGASSLAGTLRIITNKPDPSKFSAAYDVQADKFGVGAAGGMGEGFANIPINDKTAVRIVGYYEHDGGYINNTPGSVTYTFANQFPGQSLTANNSKYVQKDFNPDDVYGGRIELGVNLNDNWTITPELMAQSQQAQGSYLYDPKLPGLSVHDYSPDDNTDRWYQAAATIEGHMGIIDLVYSGGYLSRHTETDNDYTYYTVAYDKIPGYTHFPNGHGGLVNPTQQYSNQTDYTKQTHELRISLPKDSPIHLTTGLFYQRQESHSQGNYYVPGLGATGNPIVVYKDDVFYINTDNVYRDYAAFSEASYNLTQDLTLTAGVRGFIADNTGRGFSGVPGSAKRVGCAVPFTTAEANSCTNINQHIYETGETHKFNLNWQIDPSRMVYATYSTGFRPGGANTLTGVAPYKADTLTNYEIGFKTTWFGRLRWNTALYFEQWDGLQYRLVVPGNNGIGATYNAGNANIYGVETDFQYRIEQWTLSGAGSYNHAKLATNLCNLGSNLNPLPSCTPGPTTAAAAGTQLPNQPPFKGSLTARYAIPLGTIDGFVQGTVLHQTKATSYLAPFENSLLGDTPQFTTADFSLGGKRDNSTLEFFIQNAFDARGQLSHNAFCAITICSGSARIYPIKPQFFGVKFGQNF